MYENLDFMFKMNIKSQTQVLIDIPQYEHKNNETAIYDNLEPVLSLYEWVS